MHLYYNMASFLLKGVSLELTMGTKDFAGLLSFSLLASQMLMMLSAWVLLVVFDVASPMHSCTVGFSGVLFALKYVLSRRSPGVTTVSGGWAQHCLFVVYFWLLVWFSWDHAAENAVKAPLPEGVIPSASRFEPPASWCPSASSLRTEGVASHLLVGGCAHLASGQLTSSLCHVLSGCTYFTERKVEHERNAESRDFHPVGASFKTQ